MSAASSRRIKDRSGRTAGPKIAATGKSFKAITPIPISDSRFSTGKENGSGITSKVQKPAIRPVTRVDKAFVSGGVTGGDARTRWSTSSSGPRGRSPSPSDFSRMVLDVRKERRVSVDRTDRAFSSTGKSFEGSRVSDCGKQKKRFGDLGSKSSELGSNGIRVFRDSKVSGVISEKMSKVRGVSEGKTMESEKCGNGKNDISLDLRNGVDVGKTLVSCIKKESAKKARVKVEIDDLPLKLAKGENFGKKEMEEKSVNVLDVAKEGKVSEAGVDGRDCNSYPSKLHEKLAFLEGKVKRIASDIKRTKEMLDLNKPDESKVILSDIQDKISGIEKAMGRVAGDSGSKLSTLKGNEIGDQKVKTVVSDQLDLVDNSKSSVNGLNSDELEARLFPHHKLLRNRVISLKPSSTNSQSVESKAVDKPLSSIDDNPVAIEFLASLNKEGTKITTREMNAGMECYDAEEADGVELEAGGCSSDIMIQKENAELLLTADEAIDEFEDQENRQMVDDETEENSIYQVNEIGCKTSTGGWFVSEGESVLLAHDDGSCTFYDIVNNEEKAVYKPPAGVSPGIWRDCWVIRAPSADGCSGRYVVAASAGNALDSGFCSWDFYTKEVHASYFERVPPPSRTVLGPLPNNISHRNSLSNPMDPETRQWWYRPCGSLIALTSSSQRVVRIFDIRDGEEMMEWGVSKPVSTMDYSSPLQWRNRGKVAIAEAETISLWDVNSISPQALQSVSLSGRKISAFHVNNTDAELGGGVRQRLSSSEAEGNDGVFCTQDTINIMDFRNPSGIGLKIPKLGVNVQSVFSRGDSVFLGCSNVRTSGVKRQSTSEVQQFSLRKQKLFSTYSLPECNADSHYSAITQVWGNSNHVMAVSGLGLFVFDTCTDNDLDSYTSDEDKSQMVREIVGPDDMYSPSFDYSASRTLLISRDRPAIWKHLS
ncbi:hypothetical protein CsatB_030757 [Cannabis sativa]